MNNASTLFYAGTPSSVYHQGAKCVARYYDNVGKFYDSATSTWKEWKDFDWKSVDKYGFLEGLAYNSTNRYYAIAHFEEFGIVRFSENELTMWNAIANYKTTEDISIQKDIEIDSAIFWHEDRKDCFYLAVAGKTVDFNNHKFVAKVNILVYGDVTLKNVVDFSGKIVTTSNNVEVKVNDTTCSTKGKSGGNEYSFTFESGVLKTNN